MLEEVVTRAIAKTGTVPAPVPVPPGEPPARA